jgi:uncharacterized protein HemY
VKWVHCSRNVRQDCNKAEIYFRWAINLGYSATHWRMWYVDWHSQYHEKYHGDAARCREQTQSSAYNDWSSLWHN